MLIGRCARMLKPFLIGLVAGQRAMTPLALVTGAARRGHLPDGPALLSHPLAAAGASALAAAEMAGDKMKTAPNRTVPVGLLARTMTSVFAGAMVAPKDKRVAAAAVCGATAIASSFLGLKLRLAAMKRYGQTATGAAEDAALVTAGWAAVRS